MVAPTFLRMQGIAACSSSVSPSRRRAQTLSNRAFQLQYDASGITSLRRTGDEADTDYIASGGSLGRLIVRYRTTAHGDWKELRDLILARRATAESNEIAYTLATPLPALASQASGSAVQGVAGIRGLNDGVVPRVTAGGGRGGGPGTRARLGWTRERRRPTSRSSPGRRRAARSSGSSTRFPTEETVGRTEVFWTGRARSRGGCCIRTAGQWKRSRRRGPYGRDVNAFTTVEFAPVKTMALRIEVTLPAQGPPPAVAEWRVGPDPALAPPADLHVDETFTAARRSARVDDRRWPTNGRGRSRSAISPCRSPSRSAPARAATSTRRSCCATRSSAATARGSTGSAATATARTS